jgi:hypothetical protein
LVGPAAAPPPSAQQILTSGRLTDCDAHQLYIAIDVPVFEGFYNPLTDPEPKPSGLNDPTVIIAKDDPRWNPDGVDLGVDLKFQVTNIWKR